MRINIKTATTKKDKVKCFSIRRDVFVKEQNISEKIEFDDENFDATYFIAQYNNIFVGTARYRFTDLGIKLERFAVLKSYRNLGIGKELVLYILNSIKDKKSIYLHAQESVTNFYSRLGFKRIGSQFFEAEIPHQKMIYYHRYK
ncbi:MAG: GNAT family N-acetyltransferase [Candidatus Neomarinimicrobiota bacterium]